MKLDHLIIGAADLQQGIEHINSLLGVEAVYGGQHKGLGTHNALLALGPDSYLEIIAPDPAQPEVPRPLWIDATSLVQPTLFRWAAKSDDLQGLCRTAAAAGLDFGEVIPGRRQRPDGTWLSWQLTDPRKELMEGLLPFFIDWGRSVHPALGLPPAGRMVELQMEHPEPEKLRGWLEVLGLDVVVRRGARARLSAVIATAQGKVIL